MSIENLKTAEEMAAETGRVRAYDPGQFDEYTAGIRADRSAIASALDGIRAKHSAMGRLDPIGYADDVLAFVARLGRSE